MSKKPKSKSGKKQSSPDMQIEANTNATQKDISDLREDIQAVLEAVKVLSQRIDNVESKLEAVQIREAARSAYFSTGIPLGRQFDDAGRGYVMGRSMSIPPTLEHADPRPSWVL